MLAFSSLASVYDGTERIDDDYLARSEGRLGNYYFKSLMGKASDVIIIGTFNGIVFLTIRRRTPFVKLMTVYNTDYMMSYNPFTGAFKILPDPYSTSDDKYRLYGFCDCATMDDDPKIVRFRDYKGRFDYSWKTCDVINIKTGSWSTSEIPIQDAKLHRIYGRWVGVFINGFLYWLATKKIVALNVKEMVISEISLPFPVDIALVLGTLHGCLCTITPKCNDVSLFLNNYNDVSDLNYYEREWNVWVMKKEHGVENPWSILHSFEFLHECALGPMFRIVKTMGDGRILVVDCSYRAIMFRHKKEFVRKAKYSRDCKSV